MTFNIIIITAVLYSSPSR